MCAISRILRVPVPLKVARTACPTRSGVSSIAVHVGAHVDELDLAPERPQAAGDEVGEPGEAFQVAAARLDGDEFLQRVEQGSRLAPGRREDRLLRLGEGGCRRGKGDREEGRGHREGEGLTSVRAWMFHPRSFGVGVENLTLCQQTTTRITRKGRTRWCARRQRPGRPRSMASLSESGSPCRRGANAGLVALLRRDGAVGADGLAAVAVVGLAVVPGVGHDPVEGHKVSFPPWTAVTDTYAETAEFRPGAELRIAALSSG